MLTRNSFLGKKKTLSKIKLDMSKKIFLLSMTVSWKKMIEEDVREFTFSAYPVSSEFMK